MFWLKTSDTKYIEEKADITLLSEKKVNRIIYQMKPKLPGIMKPSDLLWGSKDNQAL
jgi:hypothetical protein